MLAVRVVVLAGGLVVRGLAVDGLLVVAHLQGVPCFVSTHPSSGLLRKAPRAMHLALGLLLFS